MVLCLLLVSGSVASYGQIAQQLSGRVIDATGAVVPDATITVTDEGTGVVLATKTGGTGDWVEPYLRPDIYTVKVEKTGFKTQTVTGIKLDVGQLRAVDMKLQIGAESITVSVTANQLAIQTQDADEKGTISGALIADLPQNYRNVMAAAITVAGAGSKNGLYTQLPYGNITSGIVFNSSAGSLNIDGVNNMSTGFQTMAYIPLVDTVQEMVVDNTPYDAAAVGFATAGNIDVHLKSGTNKLHGTVYEYYRSTGLDANTYQNKWKAATGSSGYFGRPSHKSNQYGFEADGPVVIPHLYDGHDKTFFTIAGEIFNLTQPGNNTFSVPGVLNQPSWLTPVNGYYQFGGLTQANGAAITLYDPTSLNPLCGSSASTGNTASCGRQSFQSEGAPNGYSIPASRVNQAALNILKYYPAPNSISPGSAPWQNNYFLQTSLVSHYKNFMIKLDHNISQKDRLTLRWGRWDQFQTQNTNGLATTNPAEYGQFPNGQAFQDPFVEWTHTFGSNAIFNLKASINMDENHNIAGRKFSATSLGLPDVSGGVTQPLLLGYFPQINFYTGNNTTNQFTQLGSTGIGYSIHNELSMIPSFSLVHGPHDLHVGLENREYQISTKQGGGGLNITANPNWTQQNANVQGTADAASGLSVASMMLDKGYLAGGNLTQPAQEYRSFHYWGAFIQDNYKASSKLTLNLGLRYDFPTQAVDRYNRYTSTFNPSAVSPVDAAARSQNGYTGPAITGALTFAGANGAPRIQIPRAWYMFEPRFGAAYALNNKTVIRGGIGMAYNWAAYTGSQTGFSAVTNINPSQNASYYTTPSSTLTGSGSPNGLFPSGYVSAPGASLGALAGLGGGISYYNPATKFGSTWSFSFGAQRQLTKGDTLDVSYVGKQFTHGPTGWAINLPGPGWFAQCNQETGGNAGLCTATTTANPFVGVNGFQGTNFYTAGSVTSPTKFQTEQFALPFPQYTGVNMNGKENRSGLWLNSIQMTETHRFANSLTATTTYEYARIMDNNGVFDYSVMSYLRIQDSNDLNHRITFVGTYKLPIGKGRMLLGNANRLVDAAIGGWNLGSLYVYESGRPWQPQCGGGNNSNLSGSTSCFETPFGIGPLKMSRSVSATGLVRGASPCTGVRNATGGITLQSSAIAAGCTQANWVLKNQYAPAQLITSTGIRLGANSEFDANLSKSFAIVENYSLLFKCDAFNVTNHAVWNNNYNGNNGGNINDGTFGSFQKGNAAQANTPRYVQLSATVRW